MVTTAYFLCVNSLLLRFVEDSFDPAELATIGFDYKTKKVTVDDNTVKLGIWVNLLI